MTEQIKTIREALKPCPFCGKKVELRLSTMFGSDSSEEYWSIHCGCLMGSPDALYDSDMRDEMIKDWNTRAIDAELITARDTYDLAEMIMAKVQAGTWTAQAGADAIHKYAESMK